MSGNVTCHLLTIPYELTLVRRQVFLERMEDLQEDIRKADNKADSKIRISVMLEILDKYVKYFCIL